MSDFERRLSAIQAANLKVWIGQSVDTSVIHKTFDEYHSLPILTSVGCAIRRPTTVKKKFDTDLRKHVGAGGDLMVDSGGFVLMKNPSAGWGVEDVSAMYERLQVNKLVSLDNPPLLSDDEDARNEKYRTTASNLEYLYKKFGDRIVPVVHGVDASERLANAKSISGIFPHPETVALGGLVPLLQRSGQTKRDRPDTPQRTLAAAIAVVRSVFPWSKIHIFGVGSVHTTLGVLALGANSTDSIGWRQAAGFGSVYLPGKHRRLLTNKLASKPCRPVLGEEDMHLLRQCVCPGCRIARQSKSQISTLKESFTLRSIHNIWVLYEEVHEFARARAANRHGEYLSKRLPEAWIASIEEADAV